MNNDNNFITKVLPIIFFIIFVIVVIGLIKITKGVDIDNKEKVVEDVTTNVTEETTTAKKDEDNNINKLLVSYNGKLSIDNNTLVNEHGEKIQLRGISSHGIQWFGDLVTKENLITLRDEWGANLFRVAMYTKENGYIDNKSIMNKVFDIVDMVIDLDMYVIIDWHILSDNNPNMNKEEAIKFFDEVSNKYKDKKNVIYEICNEPNGSTSWNNDIYPYAVDVIKTIRNNSKDSIIIVGTPTWSQGVLDASKKPIDDKLTMYALHFYSGTHKNDLRNNATIALKTIPIFVSEFGVSDASGNGGVYLDEADKWINWMNENNISWANWSLADKDESSALLIPGKKLIKDENLSKSGKYIKNIMKKR